VNLVLPNPSTPQQSLEAIITAINLDEAQLAETATAGSVTALAATVATQGGEITTLTSEVATLTTEVTALDAAAAYAKYTAAGAIAPNGRAVLLAGSAAHMTLVAPAADNLLLIIAAADSEAYVVTCGTSGKLNGGTVGTFTPGIGNCLILLSSGGVWLALVANGVTIV
jgi:hypothetical protein